MRHDVKRNNVTFKFIGLIVVLLSLISYSCDGGSSSSDSNDADANINSESFTNNFGMTFKLIPAGNFYMGSKSMELDRDSDELQMNVKLTKKFYIQTTEVTQGQWKTVMGSNPSGFANCGDDCPVERVSWDDVIEFLHELNRKEGGDKYRLPTEAEWEYAARAGTITRFCYGDTNDSLSEYAWYHDNSGGRTHLVAQNKPNAWGLYDMHGNVCEWCQNWYSFLLWDGTRSDGEYYINPVGPGDAIERVRVFRGGSYYDKDRYCRSADRDSAFPENNFDYLGFRVARTF
jgi:formylglycine-generating enzyme required for sulfatase activity